MKYLPNEASGKVKSIDRVAFDRLNVKGPENRDKRDEQRAIANVKSLADAASVSKSEVAQFANLALCVPNHDIQDSPHERFRSQHD
jgi:hypothetical protein